jgi:hypothetical protein
MLPRLAAKFDCDPGQRVASMMIPAKSRKNRTGAFKIAAACASA